MAGRVAARPRGRDEVRLTAADFRRLSDGFFPEIERRYTLVRGAARRGAARAG